MPKEKYVRVCPVCRSTDVSHEKNLSYFIQSVVFGGFFQCNDCGYHGQIFPEVPISEIGKLKEPVVVSKKSYYPTYLSRGYLAIYAALAILWLVGLLVYIATRGL
ncbi:MAG: hypothetical protein HZB68_03715 [Candidatus Aenigmarchaeota archaeon]|nr:hypothetical protein [Candidatus Aenigmarchaeota archaeon]